MSWARSWPSTKRFTLVPPDIPSAKYQISRFHTGSVEACMMLSIICATAGEAMR
jgi:hypothetical protein